MERIYLEKDEYSGNNFSLGAFRRMFVDTKIITSGTFYRAILLDKKVFIEEMRAFDENSRTEIERVKTTEFIDFSGELIYNKELLDIIVDKSRAITGANAFYLFMFEYTKQNPYIHDLFFRDIVFENLFYLIKDGCEEALNVIYAVLTHGLNTIEKIHKTYGTEFLVQNMIRTRVPLNSDGKKINRIVGLPSEVMTLIKQELYTDLFQDFKEMAELRSNDEVLVFSKFILNTQYITFGAEPYIGNTRKLLKLFKIIDRPVKDILDYLIHQTMIKSANTTFLIENSFISVYEDYLLISKDIKKEFAIDYEVFPANLQLSHYIAARNYRTVSCDENLFVEACKSYKELEYNNEKFSIIVPSSISELVNEGTKLKHCVTSYAERVASGDTRVFFLRNNEEMNEPFVTIEIDYNNKIVQAKKEYDEDIDNIEVIEFVYEWEKSISN